MINPSRLTPTQIATLISVAVLVIAVAAFAPIAARWLLPTLGILWAVIVFISAPQLSRRGVWPRTLWRLRAVALAIGIVALIRFVYLLRHAA